MSDEKNALASSNPPCGLVDAAWPDTPACTEPKEHMGMHKSTTEHGHGCTTYHAWPNDERGALINEHATTGMQLVELRAALPEVEKQARKTPRPDMHEERAKVEIAKGRVEPMRKSIAALETKHAQERKRLIALGHFGDPPAVDSSEAKDGTHVCMGWGRTPCKGCAPAPNEAPNDTKPMRRWCNDPNCLSFDCSTCIEINAMARVAERCVAIESAAGFVVRRYEIQDDAKPMSQGLRDRLEALRSVLYGDGAAPEQRTQEAPTTKREEQFRMVLECIASTSEDQDTRTLASAILNEHAHRSEEQYEALCSLAKELGIEFSKLNPKVKRTDKVIPVEERKPAVVANGERCHLLKTWPFPFEDVKAGRKPFEYRKHDRDYRVGDVLVLEKWEPNTQRYQGAIERRRVTYLLPGGTFGVPEGYCVMGLGPENDLDYPQRNEDVWILGAAAPGGSRIFLNGEVVGSLDADAAPAFLALVRGER